ncbi:hypothetical protein HYW29_00295 [Candidatus Amesbacteria bacterium]|nr:hypothetical protein [Candidatus Amesbacteria bacterium]
MPDKSEPVIQQEKVLLTWTAPVRLVAPGNRQIYTTAIVILSLVGIILAIAGEWMLIATLAALLFAYYLWSTSTPEMTSYSITTWGIRANAQLYRWPEMNRWWLDQKWACPILVIDTPFRFPPRLHIILSSAKSKDVSILMSKYLIMDKPLPTPIDLAGSWLAAKFPLHPPTP